MNARRAVTAVLYALFGLHASSQLVARDDISRQGLTLSACPVVKFILEERVVGRSLRVSVKITNTGTQNFDHTTVKLDFPADALAVEKASVFPPMKGDDRALVESSFYWLNINIAARRTRKFTLWAQTQDCKYFPSSHFKASLYLTDAEGNPRCFTSSESFGKKSNTCAPTPAPTVNPNVPYSVYAVGEKCSEGTAIEPASQDQNIQTPDQCWQYCSFYGSSALPYFFNWNVVTKECYCVGQTCTLIYDTDYTVFRVDQLATRTPTLAPTTRPTAINETFPPSSSPTFFPTTFPTSSPTTVPTQAPTRACSFGEYRDPVTRECLPCAAGTYWDQPTQTSACLDCPTDQTSLQGATECYAPCPQFSALNTTDLTCVPVPQNLQNIIIQDSITVNLNTSDIFIVEEPVKFQDTLGRADNTNNLNTTDPDAAIVIFISPGEYPVPDTTIVRVPLVLIANNGLSTGRKLQTAVSSVIVAVSGKRHFIVDSTSLIVDSIVFQGAVSAAYSGGLELLGMNPAGQFVRTTFRSCHWASNGGAVLMGGSGAQMFFETDCSFLDNSAPEGAGIYAGTGSTVTISDAVSFTNNSAPQTSSISGGGGGIFLNSAQLTLGSDVSFAANINDDITTVTSTVSCLSSSFSSACSGGCTGSYNIPTSCPFCNSPTSGSVCDTCPKGTYGGAEAELPCQLCPFGQTTVFPPSSTSSSSCVDITQSPTSVPTAVPTRVPSLSPTVVPTRVPSGAPTAVPTRAPSQLPTQSPTALFPFVRIENVTSLDTSAFPPPDVWATTQNSFNSIQSISPAPSPYGCSLRQETFNNPSKATAGISWEPSGMFNGMLFRTFVLGGFELFYNYFVLVTPVGQQNIYAPDIRIQTRSPVTGRYADFIWNPYNNQESQGPVAYQTWKDNNITQTTGSSQPWPVGPTGGEGWTCTLNCYLPVNSTDNATNTSRNLLTYVEALLDEDENSQAYVSINSAIITGLQVVLGPDEPNSISFTHDVSVQSGAYNWAWVFNC